MCPFIEYKPNCDESYINAFASHNEILTLLTVYYHSIISVGSNFRFNIEWTSLHCAILTTGVCLLKIEGKLFLHL